MAMDQATETLILNEIDKERTMKNLKKLFKDNDVSKEDQISFRKKHRPLIKSEKRGQQRAKRYENLSNEEIDKRINRIGVRKRDLEDRLADLEAEKQRRAEG